MTTGATIRRARAESGLTQSQVAARSGLPQPSISDYERDRHEPTAANLRRVLAACGMRLEVVAAKPDPTQLAARLEEVLDLAASIPTRHDDRLRFPRLPMGDG